MALSRVSDSVYIAVAGCQSGICFQKSLHTLAVGLIQLSNVNAFASPVTGSCRASPRPVNCMPIPNRPGAFPSLKAYAASGPPDCADGTTGVTTWMRRRTRLASWTQNFMTAIVGTAVARNTANAYRAFTLLAPGEHATYMTRPSGVREIPTAARRSMT